MKSYEHQRAVEVTSESQSTIGSLQTAIEALRKDIGNAKSVINSLRSDWSDIIHAKKDKEDFCAKLKAENARRKCELEKVNERYNAQRSQVAKDDGEVVREIETELGALSVEMRKEKKHHYHLIAKKKSRHEDEMRGIKERVRRVLNGKDEVVDKLREQLRNTKHKTREIKRLIERTIERCSA
jgi:chromosome segregation ATPase